MEKVVKCVHCGKPIHEGEDFYKHEYGNIYCSYRCLAVHGFYGHFTGGRMTAEIIGKENGGQT